MKTPIRILFPFIILLFCSACDSSSSVEKKRVYSKEQTTDKPSEELIGKTVNEYQEIVTEQDESNKSAAAENTQPEIEKGFQPLEWEGLIAPGYDADSILKKYDPIVSQLDEGSDEALKLYEEMQAEYNKAPANEALANKKVSIPGFIAPLEQKNGIITEFLLVPYFGACIHSPPPPANQTVHVKTASDAGINADDAYDPIWVSGELQIDKSTTDIGTASYKVTNAKIAAYDMSTR